MRTQVENEQPKSQLRLGRAHIGILLSICWNCPAELGLTIVLLWPKSYTFANRPTGQPHGAVCGL